MYFLLVVVLSILGLMAIAVIGLRLLAGNVENSPEYQADMARLKASYDAEETVIEVAPWIGKTGLPEEIERELPKYLRREFGELLLDEGSFRASDLEYVGVFPQTHGKTHFWKIPRENEPTFATVAVGNDGSFCTGWGSEGPDHEIWNRS